MRGHKRFKVGRLAATVNATDPVTGKRKPIYATVHAPNNKRGEAKADSELAKLVAQVETGRTMPTSGMTVDQLIERYIVDRSPSWAPGAADETRRAGRAAHHARRRLDRPSSAAPVDVQQLHAMLRAAGMSEGSIGRVHDILRAASHLGGATGPHRPQTRRPRSTRPRGTRARHLPPAPRPTSCA